jgi:NAD(P)-dependent dehydrogenase (short-subunit alcohol dehydrogenase family)
MTGLLEGRVAFITGGASGIGAATTQILAREGAKVAIVDVDREGGQDMLSELRSYGAECIFICADVSLEQDVQTALQQTVNKFGRLDCAINNAGINGKAKAITDYALDEWDRVMSVNLTGVWLCIQEEIRQMLDTGPGSIVNVASGAGLSGHPANAPYSASKHGVIGITKSAAIQYGPSGIRINAVCPGVIETPLAARLMGDAELSSRLLKRHVLGRFGAPKEVGETIAWLCSDLASFVTGAAIPVDGGYLS